MSPWGPTWQGSGACTHGDAYLGAPMLSPTAQPRQQGLPWLNRHPRRCTGALSPLPVADPSLVPAAVAAGRGLPGPPASSREPPRSRRPPEARSALPGLPGKQLLFCSSPALARAAAGRMAASLPHRGLAAAAGLSSAQDVPPEPAVGRRWSQPRFPDGLLPPLSPARSCPSPSRYRDRPRHATTDA